MRTVPCLLVIFLCALPAYTVASSGQIHTDPDEATLSSVRPRIPEPMVFDLVRPLGAQRGELEVNSLFRVSPGAPQGHLLWAPEVEYAFANGHGVEFELPMAGGRIESVKLALQGTLPGPSPHTFIHGWQGIWERARDGGAQVDLLYLAGVRWHRRWSAFTMNGVRQERHGAVGPAYLANVTLFHHVGKETSFGLETNVTAGRVERRLLLMPQVHTRKSRYNLQGGLGIDYAAGRAHAQAAWRLSREF